MGKYVVLTYRPAYPERGVKFQVLPVEAWPDQAPPTVTAAWHVEGVRTKQEAIAVALEKGAGVQAVTASTILPQKPRPTFEQARRDFIEIAHYLSAHWDHRAGDQAYPTYLPSFDQFVSDLVTWRDGA